MCDSVKGAEIRLFRLQRWKKGLGAKEGSWPLEAEKGREMNSSLRPSEEMQPC